MAWTEAGPHLYRPVRMKPEEEEKGAIRGVFTHKHTRVSNRENSELLTAIHFYRIHFTSRKVKMDDMRTPYN